jgi:hypothetical protein
MVDDLDEAEDGAASRGVASGGEERNLGFRVLGVLEFRVQGAHRSWGRFRVRSR